MELNDNALRQLQKDIERINARIDERHARVSFLQGKLDILRRVVQPLHPDIAVVEVTQIVEELHRWQKDQDETDIELDAMATLLKDHIKTEKEKKEDGPNTVD